MAKIELDDQETIDRLSLFIQDHINHERNPLMQAAMCKLFNKLPDSEGKKMEVRKNE